jgi:EamA domain-containing membrane protein RarD
MMSLYSSQTALDNMSCIVYLGYGGTAGYAVVVVVCVRIWCVFIWYKLTQSAVAHDTRRSRSMDFTATGSFNFYLSKRKYLSSESIAGFGLGIWLISLIPIIAYFGSHPDQAAAKLNSPECGTATASLGFISSSFLFICFIMIFVLYWLLRNVQENLSLVSEFRLILGVCILSALFPSLASLKSYVDVMDNPKNAFLHQALSSWVIEMLLQWISLWRTSALADEHQRKMEASSVHSEVPHQVKSFQAMSGVPQP